MTGIILLAVIAVLVLWLWGKVMGRMNMRLSKNGKIAIVFIFVVVVLALWGQTIKK